MMTMTDEIKVTLFSHPYLFFDLACSCHNEHDDVAHSHCQQPSCLQHRLHVGRSLRKQSKEDANLDLNLSKRTQPVIPVCKQSP